MSSSKFKQLTLNVTHDQRREVRTQFGALCWRVKNEEVQVLLVTSRRSGRWIVPKGWPIDGETPADAAATEAWEEAGATGKAGTDCLGIFSYTKDADDGDDLSCVVAVFPLKVKKLARSYPEAKERQRKWFSQKKAAKQVDEPELRQIITQFSPKI